MRCWGNGDHSESFETAIALTASITVPSKVKKAKKE
jgi:hypothetical protein